MMLMNYKYSDSILFSKHSTNNDLMSKDGWDEDVLCIDRSYFDTVEFFDQVINNSTEGITANYSKIFRFENTLLVKVRQPYTLIEAMSKIGGLFVILKVAILLRLTHEYLFERTLSRDLSLQNLHISMKDSALDSA